MEILHLCIKETLQEEKCCWEQTQTKFGLMGQEQEISGLLKLQITKINERLAFLQSTNKERSATLDMLRICCSAIHTARHLYFLQILHSMSTFPLLVTARATRLSLLTFLAFSYLLPSQIWDYVWNKDKLLILNGYSHIEFL